MPKEVIGARAVTRSNFAYPEVHQENSAVVYNVDAAAARRAALRR